VCIEIHLNLEELGTSRQIWRRFFVAELEIKALKIVKKQLLSEKKQAAKREKRVYRWMDRQPERRQMLDRKLLAFRVARETAGKTAGWLRAIRQAAGVRVEDVAERLGVSRWEVFRREKAEETGSIQLGSLRRAAEALDCELIYALVPRQGTLETMAVEQKAAREQEWKAAVEKKLAAAKEREEAVLEEIDWKAAMRRVFRRKLRAAGVRVR
jgi:predicted DNA-binding mobile mystery protein A